MKLTPAPIRAPRAALLLAAGWLAALALAGCQTDGAGQPVARAAPPEPVSHEQAAVDCWMGTEHGHADLPLDKRADIVDACIKAKMAGKPLPAAMAAKPNKHKKPKANSTAKSKTKQEAKRQPKA
jgi:hypothetical protein